MSVPATTPPSTKAKRGQSHAHRTSLRVASTHPPMSCPATAKPRNGPGRKLRWCCVVFGVLVFGVLGYKYSSTQVRTPPATGVRTWTPPNPPPPAELPLSICHIRLRVQACCARTVEVQ